MSAEITAMALAEYQEMAQDKFPSSLQAVFHPDAKTCLVEMEVDARQMLCPMPLLKAKQALRGLASGQQLRVVASDSGTLKDFVSFAHLAQHSITDFYADDSFYYYVLKKGTL